MKWPSSAHRWMEWLSSHNSYLPSPRAAKGPFFFLYTIRVTLALAFALIVAQIALLLALAVFIFEHAGYVFSGFLDVPYVPTRRRYYPLIIEALQIRDGDVVYDLGCGNGRFLLACARAFPRTRFVGIERNYMLYLQTQFWRRRAGNPVNIFFRRENFYRTDLSDATRVYAYLLSSVMEKLFATRDQKGLRIVSRAFFIKGRTPLCTITLTEKVGNHGQHQLHVYEL